MFGLFIVEYGLIANIKWKMRDIVITLFFIRDQVPSALESFTHTCSSIVNEKKKNSTNR